MRTHRLLFLLVLGIALPHAHGQSLQILSQVGSGLLTTVSNGGVVAIASDGVGRPASALITLRNAGLDLVVVNHVSISGSLDFTLPGLGNLPASLPPGSSFSFLIQYQPTSANRSVASLQIQTSEGGPSVSRTYGFQVAGSAPDFSVRYWLSSDSSTVALDSGGHISFGSANLQSTLVANLIVTNRGSAAGTFQSASAAPYPDFQLSGLPSLPVSVNPGEAVQFQVLFTPRVAGRATGTLALGLGGDRTFTALLDGAGTAPDLRISYMLPANQNVLPLSDGGQLVFLATSMGSTSTATVYIENRGTGSGTVNGVSLSGNGFELAGLPPFPVTVDPGKVTSFAVRFKPTASGRYTGSLTVDLKDKTVTVTIDGSTAPADFYLSYSDSRLNNSTALSDGSQLAFPATSLNSTSTLKVLIENRGKGSGILNAVSLAGTGFELAGLPTLPLTVEAGGSVTFSLIFRPLSNGHFSGTLTIDLKDRVFTLAVDGTTAAPNFSLSYIDPVLNNGVPVSNGGVIPYPDTLTTAKSDVLVVFENRGSGSGVVNSITVTGDAAFQSLQLPILPYTIDASKDLRFLVRFSPVSRQVYAGKLQITLADQTVYTLRLEGTGIGPAFSYSLVTADTTTPLLPDGNIAFEDAELNQTSKVVLRVSNTGTAEGKLTTLLITGAAFAVTDAPLPPVTIKPGDSIQLTLAFTPTQSDASNGRLRIGDDTFTLSGKGIGVKWEYSFTKGQATTTLDGNGAVLLGSAAVGEQSTVQFTIVNRGNKVGPVFSLMLTGSGSGAFQLEGAPALPANIAPASSVTFTIRFQPDNIGTAFANLVVNSVAFAVVGDGLAPQRLPKFTFTGASGTQEPMQQPGIGLALSEPYPLPLQGTLTLDFVSEVFGGNPAVQFATGGRVAPFTIPANGTEAVFANGAKTVRLQTGTVAGNIVARPAFATQAGLDLTPINPAVFTATLNRSVPKLTDAKITNRSLGGFVLSVTGYSTTRALKQMTLNLAPSAGSKLSGTQLTVDLQSAALLWFQSAASQAFGGLFTVSVPITVQGNGNGTEDRVAKLSSVSVTATNEVGTSIALTVPIQ